MVDAGDLLFTDQNLYFGGQHSSFTISFTSILRLEQYIDGIGIFPSHGTQKVFIPVMQFGIEIGWFVTHLAKFLLEQAQQD